MIGTLIRHPVYGRGIIINTDKMYGNEDYLVWYEKPYFWGINKENKEHLYWLIESEEYEIISEDE